ncbi:hypothetical protein CVT24_006904 [Panaeolus cyanescens]|uniref:Uncharacterized protein n=1 Tax=Panaeolus cyanescens TaxID=181874 RepID=A0A409XAC1_9AGAR|nr:hypothetical protein CVT24_006904 [Panaeolus cyanescens]
MLISSMKSYTLVDPTAPHPTASPCFSPSSPRHPSHSRPSCSPPLPPAPLGPRYFPCSSLPLPPLPHVVTIFH